MNSPGYFWKQLIPSRSNKEDVIFVSEWFQAFRRAENARLEIRSLSFSFPVNIKPFLDCRFGFVLSRKHDAEIWWDGANRSFGFVVLLVDFRAVCYSFRQLEEDHRCLGNVRPCSIFLGWHISGRERETHPCPCCNDHWSAWRLLIHICVSRTIQLNMVLFYSAKASMRAPMLNRIKNKNPSSPKSYGIRSWLQARRPEIKKGEESLWEPMRGHYMNGWMAKESQYNLSWLVRMRSHHPYVADDCEGKTPSLDPTHLVKEG